MSAAGATGAFVTMLSTPFDTAFDTVIAAGGRVVAVGPDQLVGFGPDPA
jgi:hypothetical protein